jgi:pimeloyl-ACP methyl ester carboxylesterase
VKQKSLLGITTSGFHRIAYTEWGESDERPAVVCVHGLTRNGRDFDFVAEALQSERRVACPDIVGRGRSGWLADKQNYTLPTYCADMTALLARLDSESFDWVGTSMGAFIGIILAAQPNTPVKRLVINDAGPLAPKAASQRILSYVGQAPAFASIGAVESYLRQVHAPFGELSDAQWSHLARHSARKTTDGSYALVYDPDIVAPMRSAPPQDLDLWPLWDQIRCPVLVLRGAQSDVLLPETVDEMRRRGPDIEVVEFANVGHAPALMDAEQIGVIKDWLLE